MTTPEPPEPPPDPRPIPVVSVVGVIALVASLLLFSLAWAQDRRLLDRIEVLQARQVEFARAVPPANKLLACNLVRYLAAYPPPPTRPEQRAAVQVLEQNAAKLDCPAGIVELTGDPTATPP